MSIEDTTKIVPEVATISPFQKLVLSIGEIPTNYLDSMSYAEQVTWFCMFLQEKVLPVVNQHSEKILEIINYLNNLDLQDEVNNKLDEMAESGQLQEIIGEYLNATALWCFDNVESMKEATNLIDGSYTKTLGYYTKNDGGMAIYKIRTITNDDIVDEMFIIALSDNSLIAELIPNSIINIKCLGAKGDNENDDTEYFVKAINKKQNIYIPDGTFIVSSTLTINDNYTIDGNGYDSKINYIGSNFLFNINVDLSHKPIIKNIHLNGLSTNSCLKCARDGFGASFIMENCTITSFDIKVFELTSVFDPIIRNVRIISAGKILFNTYDGSFDENSFSNNILFEHVYYTGDPDPAPLLFDLNNVRYLNFIGCQFEKITKLIEAKNNTKFVILDHSWVEGVTNFYTVDSSSENIIAKNTNVVLTTNYDGNATVLDYLKGNDKDIVNIKNNNNDSFNAMHDSDNITLEKMLIYNKNNNNYPYIDIYRIGTKETTFNMPINITISETTNVSSASYQVKNISKYSSVPMIFNILIDAVYADGSERFYEFKLIQKQLNTFRLCTINKIFESTWSGSGTSQYTETITQDSGNITITSTGTMARCIIRIKHEFIK